MTGYRSWSEAPFSLWKGFVYRLLHYDRGGFLKIASELVCNLFAGVFLGKNGVYL